MSDAMSRGAAETEAAAVVAVALRLAASAADPAMPYGLLTERSQRFDEVFVAGVTDGVRRGQIACDADLESVLALQHSQGPWIPSADPSVHVLRADYPDPILYAAAWERYARGWPVGFEAIVRKRIAERDPMSPPPPSIDPPIFPGHRFGARAWGQVALGVSLISIGALLVALGSPATRPLGVLQWGVVLLGFVIAVWGIGVPGRG